MKIPKFKLVGTMAAVTYNLRVFNSPYGEWAHCTVNDEDSSLSVVSDWGNWSHRWCSPSFGSSANLTEFIATCGTDYLANKLYGNYGRSFSADATVKYLKTELRSMKRNFEIDNATYRDAVEQLSGLDNDERTCVDRILDIEGPSGEPLFSEPWYLLQSEYDSAYLVLLKGILPALRLACKKASARRKKLIPAIDLSDDIRAATKEVLVSANMGLASAPAEGSD